MDATQKHLMDQLARIGFTAIGTAAITGMILSMFQDSSITKTITGPNPHDTKSSLEGSSDSTSSGEGGRDSDAKILPGITKVGDASVMLPPKFVEGLILLSERASKLPTKFGWFDNWGVPTLILTKPEHVKYVFYHNVQHALFPGLVPPSAAFFGKKVLFILEGDEWKTLRRVMKESLKRQALPLLTEDVTACAFELSQKIAYLAEREQAVDMNYALSAYHLCAVAQSSFGYRLNCLDNFFEGPEEILNAFEFMLSELPRRAFSPDPAVNADYTSDNEDNRKWNKHAKTVRDVITNVITARLKERASGFKSRNDLLNNMIDLYEQEAQTNAQSSDPATIAAHIGDNLIELLFAGVGTSVGSAATALYFIATNPEWYERVQKEVDEVIADSGTQKGVAYHHSQFPTLTRIFKETMRLIPSAPLGFRSIQTDTNLDGVNIPAGTPVYIPVIYLHNDKSVWGPDADRFNPDRFLNEPVPGSYVPFNLGERECVGQHFAMLESIVAMAVLLKDFTFTVAEGYTLAPSFTGFGIRPSDATTKKVCLNLVPKRRTNTAEFMFDWSPMKRSRRRASEDRTASE